MKHICILGGTGSIGTQVLDIIDAKKDLYLLEAFSFGHNINKAIEIISKFKPKLVVTPFLKEYIAVKRYIRTNKLNILVSLNLLDIVNRNTENQVVINALVGSCGLEPTIEAIKKGKVLLLANKESLVMAGSIVLEELNKSNSVLIPIDSEHSALYQLINEVNYHDILNIYITASGGALRDFPIERLKSVRKEDALKHPNWQMGSKITIDSATMMNKVFELVEAKYLFGFKNPQALIDRTSKIHAAIELKNGEVLYHTSNNDMHLPIEYAMTYPNMVSYNEAINRLSSIDELINKFNLEKIDYIRYPLIKYGKMILEDQSFLGTIVTVCNDYLVEMFLHNQLLYTDIERIMDKVVLKVSKKIEKLEFNFKNILYVKKIVLKEVKKCFGMFS